VLRAPRSPGLDPAADRDWTQECTDRNLDQDRRQDSEEGPLQQPAMDEESETLVIPSFKLSMMCMAWNAALVNLGSPVLSAPPRKYEPFPTPYLWDLKGLLVTLVAMVIVINRGLFLHSNPTVSSVKL